MYEIERDGKAQKVQTSISHQAASCHHHQHSAFEIFVIMIEFLIFKTSLQSSAKKKVDLQIYASPPHFFTTFSC